MTTGFILASASRSRQKMLLNAGVSCQSVAADINEAAVKAAMKEQGAFPKKISDQLAFLKAERVSGQFPGQVVLGVDQLLECENQLFDKPKNIEEAQKHLQFFRGKKHYLHTSYVLVQDGKKLYGKTVSPCLTMRDFSHDFLEEYLKKSGEIILSSVGCYLLEDQGPQLFTKIEGDYFTILGLPLLEVMKDLRELGLLKS